MEETNQEQQEAPRKKSSLSFFKLVLFMLVVGVVVAGGYLFLQESGVLDKTVAVVNSEKISQSQYDDYHTQVAAVFESQGLDINDEEIKATLNQRVIDDLIAETLVLQKAKEANIIADTELVLSQFEQSKSQFADEAAFQVELTNQGFTVKTFKEMLVRQNIFQKYIQDKIDLTGVTVDEGEVEEFYGQASASGENVPPLEDVYEQIEQEILRQKQQLVIVGHIQGLRSSSTVEIL